MTLIGCLEVSDYLDLIIAKGWEEQVYSALAGWLQSGDAPAGHLGSVQPARGEHDLQPLRRPVARR
ncbi:MAG: hypothetical protein R2838_17265 [Caldilineaceae bacterium]